MTRLGYDRFDEFKYAKRYIACGTTDGIEFIQFWDRDSVETPRKGYLSGELIETISYAAEN
jgi:hypothetical protein